MRPCSKPNSSVSFPADSWPSRNASTIATWFDEPLNAKSSPSGHTTDPRFRHILGQRSSSFSLLQAIDDGYLDQVKLATERLITFHFRNGRRFGSRAALANFLDTPADRAVLKQRMKDYRWALKHKW
jgi:hypothetical protein